MDKDDNCCAATSGLGVQNYGGLTDGSAALQQQMMDGLTELEKAWVAGYIQGRKE